MARLDDPLKINGMLLRNRLALAPITTGYGTREGTVTDRVVGFYDQRARHLGLVIVEATAVQPDGRIIPNSLGLWEDAQTEGMRSVAGAIKQEGAAAVVQLNHSGANGAPSSDGTAGVSPSGVPLRPDLGARMLDEDGIGEIVMDFVAAAQRAKKAGFDGVEVHAAHFYLLSQFLSPVTNRRTDRYGGDTAGRATFAVEVVQAIRAHLGQRYPILVRLNAMEGLDGGLTVDDAKVIAQRLERAGADAIHVSGMPQAQWREVDGQSYPGGSTVLNKQQRRGTLAPHAATIKLVVGVPVITVGKLGDAIEAARVVGTGMADVVAIGRQMIADPETAQKILEGRNDDILQCRECLACFASLRSNESLSCAINRDPSSLPDQAIA